MSEQPKDVAERCQRCGTADLDLRTLWMSCLYEMGELDVPFHVEIIDDRHFYCLRVCKDCRADWLNAIRDWFAEVQCNVKRLRMSKPVTGVYVRSFGATVEATPEQVEELRKRNQP